MRGARRGARARIRTLAGGAAAAVVAAMLAGAAGLAGFGGLGCHGPRTAEWAAVAAGARQVGAAAPDAPLVTPSGRPTTMAAELDHRQTVVVFYYGFY